MSAKRLKLNGNHHFTSARFDPIAIRTARGPVNQAEFAERMKVGEATYGVAERGGYVSLRTAHKIKKFTGVDFTFYANDSDDVGAVPEPVKDNFNYDPETCLMDKALGERQCSLFPGRLCLVKWHDPGGKGYAPGLPYDRPNRVLMVRDLTGGRRLWWEFNLTDVRNGAEKWDKPTHVWTEVSHEFPALGHNRPGVVIYRIDTPALAVADGRVQVVEFFIPNDVGERLKSGLNTTIWWRKTTERDDFSSESRSFISSSKPFVDLGFEIVHAVYDL